MYCTHSTLDMSIAILQTIKDSQFSKSISLLESALEKVAMVFIMTVDENLSLHYSTGIALKHSKPLTD